jgi:Domain of unknown function (DUF6468)
MSGMEWILELVLAVLLLATLFQALRLERALGVLKRDRGELEALVAGFNASTRQAENGIERLRSTADGAGRQLERQIAASVSLKDDLSYLTERGDRLADRLDTLVRTARPLSTEPTAAPAPPAATISHLPASRIPASRSQAESGLLQALRMVR